MKVLAALSGGVDSAVAAARAAEAGHQVVGVHMALMRNRSQTRQGSRGCCSIEDASDARRAAEQLGLDFYVWDLSEEFEDLVVQDFLQSYAAGRTPNPCVRCNEFIKFQVLLERGLALGFDAITTGHYARVKTTAQGGVSLRRGRDLAKDQSYVLAVAGPQALRHCLFPLGEARSKDEVRLEAAQRGLPVAEKPDSYDICFVADGDTQGFLRSRLGERPGPVLDQDGVSVGTHTGAYQFTVGQRRGLHLGRPAADGAPRYVTGIDTASGVVRVGPVGLLRVDRFMTSQAVWLDPAAQAQVLAGEDLACLVQLRAHGTALPGRVRQVPGAEGPRQQVTLDQPMRGLAAGQAAVFYQGDRVLAATTVEEVPTGTATAVKITGQN